MIQGCLLRVQKCAVGRGQDVSSNVLLVEDDAQVHKFSASALRHLGYSVLETSESSTALNILAEHSEIALKLDSGFRGSMSFI